jgi:hypothetical protein
MPMIKIYSLNVSVYSKSEHAHYYLQTLHYGKLSLNKQFLNLLKRFKANPRKEVIDRIIEYAKS